MNRTTMVPKVLAAAALLLAAAATPAHADPSAGSGFAPDNPLACDGVLNQVSVPFPAVPAVQQVGWLTTAAAAGDRDVWFAGGFTNGNITTGGPNAGGRDGAEIEHFDGVRLTGVPHPLLGDNWQQSYAIAFSSASDGWMFGIYQTLEEQEVTPADGTLVPLEASAEHWDGHRWMVTPLAIPDELAGLTPDGADGGVFIQGAVDLAPDNAWAVGYTGGAAHSLIEHWDGTAWSVVPGPTDGQRSALFAVSGTSADNVWAVGRSASADGSIRHSLIEHWDGRRWSIVPSPDPVGSPAAVLLSVSATSGTDAWAAGQYIPTPGEVIRGLIKHWDGHAWTDVSTAFPSRGDAAADREWNVVSRGPADAYVVGDAGLEHWNGHSWSLVPVAADPGRLIFQGLTVTPSGTVWVAGQDTSNDVLAGGRPRARVFHLCGTSH